MLECELRSFFASCQCFKSIVLVSAEEKRKYKFRRETVGIRTKNRASAVGLTNRLHQGVFIHATGNSSEG